ncbi:MAG: Gfo/Idh/MocA family oxidoreductase [Bacteroidales bacterium]|jgi:predicted dehydrogenase|nr:Gfo/Idh/MocA family oxidoreductase [Bacteroidales bacterium]
MSSKNFSRRNFIGLTGLAGAGLALSGNPLMAAQPLHTEAYAGKTFKVGIIGCGNRSKALIGALNSVPELEMAALCDIVPHKMNQRAQLIKTGAKPKFVNSLDELLKMPELDAIVVITPNDTHKDVVIAALEADKHVFCEKPMAITVADCNEMLGTVERTRKVLQIGHQRRHSPEWKLLVETINTKPVGKVLQSSLFDYRGDWRVPDADEYPAGVEYWRLNQARSGGVVYEMGAHIIDVNNWVFDSEPIAICSLQGVNNFSLRKRDSSDHGGVLVQYANGAMMNYGGNVYNYGATALDTFFCVNGTVQLGGGVLSIKYGSPAGFPKPKDMPQPEQVSLKERNQEGDGTAEQFRNFAKAMEGKAKAFPDGYIGRRCVQVMEGSLRSAKARRVIDVNELG